jgi:hypothetical protein
MATAPAGLLLLLHLARVPLLTQLPLPAADVPQMLCA